MVRMMCLMLIITFPMMMINLNSGIFVKRVRRREQTRKPHVSGFTLWFRKVEKDA